MLFSAPTTTALVALLSGAAQAQYVLDVRYDSSNFLADFAWFTEPDPTHGFVNYISQEAAIAEGLTSVNDGALFMGVDTQTVNPEGGRKSVRITSNRQFNHGLFIADFDHVPDNVCGTWPAYWSFGPNWPASGEIDMYEGVHNTVSNSVTLHTNEGCFVTNEGTGFLKDPDCGIGSDNVGCGIETSDPNNYGSGLNSVNGGVYATQWTSEFIAVWFFPRANIPADIANGSPDPSSWPQPMAKFVGGGGCNLDSFIMNQNLVFDTTFCGDWAGAVWDSNPTCAALAPTCIDWVSNNPQAFSEVYWSVNSITVYQRAGSVNEFPPTNGNRTAVPFKA